MSIRRRTVQALVIRAAEDRDIFVAGPRVQRDGVEAWRLRPAHPGCGPGARAAGRTSSELHRASVEAHAAQLAIVGGIGPHLECGAQHQPLARRDLRRRSADAIRRESTSLQPAIRGWTSWVCRTAPGGSPRRTIRSRADPRPCGAGMASPGASPCVDGDSRKPAASGWSSPTTCPNSWSATRSASKQPSAAGLLAPAQLTPTEVVALGSHPEGPRVAVVAGAGDGIERSPTGSWSCSG